jgi:hypothetical protein
LLAITNSFAPSQTVGINQCYEEEDTHNSQERRSYAQQCKRQLPTYQQSNLRQHWKKNERKV